MSDEPYNSDESYVLAYRESEARVAEEQDRRQRMMFAGDALATALHALAPQHVGVHELIDKWDEAKDA